ncbi:phenylacetic acid degradation bifunctional protein PaaZ [Aquipuribacter nitratireducens]|uniref:Phenylacetic acid degradation bifunctional protein PaaZ n=1 Tax=Aquipuribacter nitratireducens TaxID=650104 RepID=A0ABW0GTV8_9MICO
MALLESYVAGAWRTPDDEGAPLLDAATGAEVARISTRPVAAADAVRHAREVGGPALRAMTFHERAMLVKELALALKEHLDELYELSYATGATARDTAVDVDGGIVTMLGMSSVARRTLPNDVVAVDGPVERVSRGGTFLAQHVWTPLRGVAVQVNAYNFPVWGALEKLAPALVAGVPSIVKPAEQTSYVTERTVRLALATGILPEGALQLLVGAPDGLLDALDAQDLLGFTGSAETAAVLRAHPAVVQRGVRFTAEADSLNAAVLGPDATPGTPEFDLFVTEVAREMTVKAGQKCTAVRRAFVPSSLLADVEGALAARLATATVGDPRDPATRVGALVDLEQRDAVRAATRRIAADASVVSGSLDDVAVAGLERGAFMAPVLLRAHDARSSAAHEVEPFGPVASLMAYDRTDEVVDLLALGRGSLVASVVSHDERFVRDVVLGAAAHHGRVLVLDRDDAAESTGHGSPLPHLVHGGPGRAGGGEELGGVRGVFHHMQRTAVQGSPDMLTAVTGQWVAGSRRRTDGPHPFRKSMAELAVGDAFVSDWHDVTAEDIDSFAVMTGDTFYAHTDPDAAAANPIFGGIVAHGYWVLSRAAGLFVDPAPGPVLANTGLENLRFTEPVRVGDRIRVALTCKALNPREHTDYGEVRWDAQVTNDRDELCATYTLLTMVTKQPR